LRILLLQKNGLRHVGTTGKMKKSGSKIEKHEGFEYSIAAEGLLK
jgi:hypothetical protein